MRDALITLGIVLMSLGALMAFASYEFQYQRLEVLPWIFLSFFWGAATVLLWAFWAARSLPKQRRQLDDFAGQVVQVELPTEHTTKH